MRSQRHPGMFQRQVFSDHSTCCHTETEVTEQICCLTQSVDAGSTKKRCFHKLLAISYRDHITNEEMKARIGHAIGPHEDLLTSAKRRKLKWYGHVTRSSGLPKTILQGTVQGGRQRGRQRKRCEDNIKEWTGLEWNIILRKVEKREEWRKLVVKSTVVPQRSARLRGRLLLLVGCLTSQQHASVSQGRICSHNFTCSTLRKKLQIQLSISPSHSILTPDRPVPALTL